jgi:hypothetical protein
MTYYISPSGADSKPGSSPASPWRTFPHAISRLNPGDTLVLLDGTYTTAEVGSLFVNCGRGGNAKNGMAANPITIKAHNERQAYILKNDPKRSPIWVYQCQWYVIEGFHLSEQKTTAATDGNTGVYVSSSSNIVVRRNLIHDMNPITGSGGITVFKSSDVLVEENELYNFNRNGIFAQRSNRITFRRNFCNAGSKVPVTAGTGGSKGPQVCFNMYYSHDGVYENNIAQEASLCYGNSGQRNKFLGNIAINCTNLFLVGKHPSESFSNSDGYYENNIGIAFPNAIYKVKNGVFIRSAQNLVWKNGTIFGGSGNGVVADNIYDPRQGLGKCRPYSFICKNQQNPEITVQNTVVIGTAGGYTVDNAEQFARRSFEYSLGWNNKDGTWRRGTETRDKSTTPPLGVSTAPDIGSCKAFIPASSSLKGKGKSGSDIGANILYIYEKGVLTNKPLWNPRSGHFPCGAVVRGVNDTPSQSCFDVHLRLNIAHDGCSLPAKYASSQK